MHIAIDGLDGAGKTTAAREVARRLGFSYVEKPLSAVSDPEGGLQEYLRFTSYINLHTDLEFRAMIYGAEHIWLLFAQGRRTSCQTDTSARCMP